MSENNTGIYLIAEKIEFHPAFSSLVCRTNSQVIMLKPAAASCLLLMLKKHKILITQNEMMAFAWGDNYRQVPFNAFYQSILSLRKAFTFLGMEQAIIQTVPRKGVLIPETVSVEYIAGTSADLNAIGVVALDIPETTITDAMSISERVLKENEDADKSQQINGWTWLSLMTVIVFMLVLIPIWQHFSNTSYFSGYLKKGTTEGRCAYYINPDMPDTVRQLRFLHSHTEICSGKEDLYLTSYENTGDISVVSCTVQDDKNAEKACRSFYFPDYREESEK